jgi:hypothetical protein
MSAPALVPGSDEKSDGKTHNDSEHVFGTYETIEGWWNT